MLDCSWEDNVFIGMDPVRDLSDLEGLEFGGEPSTPQPIQVAASDDEITHHAVSVLDERIRYTARKRRMREEESNQADVPGTSKLSEEPGHSSAPIHPADTAQTPEPNTHRLHTYRSRQKVNEAMDDLRTLLPDFDASIKLPKAEILTQASAYIRRLKHQNECLQAELRLSTNNSIEACIRKLVKDGLTTDEGMWYAVRNFVRMICFARKWDFGEYWTPNISQTNPLAMDYLIVNPQICTFLGDCLEMDREQITTELIHFQQTSRVSSVLHPGSTDPVMIAFQTQQPQWNMCRDSEGQVLSVYGQRREAIQRAEFASHMTIPVFDPHSSPPSQTLSVMSFYSRQPHPCDEDLATVAQLLGYYLESPALADLPV